VEALAVVDNSAAAGALQAIAQDKSTSAEFRSRAVVALAEREGTASAKALQKVLADPKRQMREQAIQALAGTGGPKARGALEERLPHEEDARLRELIQRSLSRMQP
jgi:HEAT repeat protein